MEIKSRFMCILCLIFECTKSQYISDSTSQYISKPPKPCVNTVLVERFFGIMFAEFHTTPPVCVCVQMCVDQPTYCYPNGCFKRPEKIERTPPVSRIQQDGSKTMFLVDSQRDYMSDVVHGVSASPAGKTENVPDTESMARPNPFREMVFKYKKLPKLQMKYNLREQVKNTKHTKKDVDVSKTRWPTNKQMNRPYKMNKVDTPSNYFMSGITDEVPKTKYFKRYLAKRDNQNTVDIGSLYLYKIDASNFSLETLIDNLIEGGLSNNITSEFKTNNSNLKVKDKSGTKIVRKSLEIDLLAEANSLKYVNNLVNENITENTSPINFVIGNNDGNYYKEIIDTDNDTKPTYSDMITTMSKEIDKQNNTSMEIMERLIGYNKLDETNTNVNDGTNGNIRNISTVKLKEKDTITEKPKVTTNKTPKILPDQFMPFINSIRKSKQRVTRKLRNKKVN